MRVAIVGSGPSGFYAAEALQKASPGVQIDMFERLGAPFGLVRYGVAPDHPKLKMVTRVFETIAAKPGFRLFANIEIGTDVSVDELRSQYDGVIFACGAPGRRRLNVEGAALEGVYDAGDFVAWYNGHPDYADARFNLQTEAVVIIGQGNVALDVARMLLKPVEALRSTDIADHALQTLAHSKVKKVYLVGRRGPVQAKFTTKELHELDDDEAITCTVASSSLTLGDVCRDELDDVRSEEARQNVQILQRFQMKETAGKELHFLFYAQPSKVLGSAQVSGLELVRTVLQGPPFEQEALPLDERIVVPCGAIFSSIGYAGAEIAGLPFDDSKKRISHRGGRIVDKRRSFMPGLYCTGWAKRGPSGVIGTNRMDSIETVNLLLKDLEAGAVTVNASKTGVADVITERRLRPLNLDAWRRIDQLERTLGESSGKARSKLVRQADLVAAGRGES